jgi:hypothetical protein
MSRKLVATCKIGSERARIYIMPEGWSEAEGLLGCCQLTEHGVEIQLSSGLHPARFNETLLHELTHAISGVAGLHFSEQTVSTFGLLAAQAFRSFKPCKGFPRRNKRGAR